MTPAATVSGATPARTKNSTAGTPSRSRASARDTLLGLLPAVCVLDIDVAPGYWLMGRAAVISGGGAGRWLPRPGSGCSGPAAWGGGAAPPAGGRGRALDGGTCPACRSARQLEPR